MKRSRDMQRLAGVLALSWSSIYGVAAQTANDELLEAVDLVVPDLSSVSSETRQLLEDARRELEQLVEATAPSSVVVEKLNFLGELYVAYGFEDAALETLAQVAELAPQSWRTHYVLGYLNERQGNLDAAVAAPRARRGSWRWRGRAERGGQLDSTGPGCCSKLVTCRRLLAISKPLRWLIPAVRPPGTV